MRLSSASISRSCLCGAMLALSGCAISMTAALGEHASAAIYTPPVCPPATLAQPVGTRTVVTEQRIGKLGPDEVITTTTTEPAVAPQPEAVALQESVGADVAQAGGIIRTVVGFVGGVVKGLFGWFIP